MKQLNQKQYWNNAHRNNKIEAYTNTPSEFAKEVIAYFPKNSKIIELGCGLGNDSVFFSQNGHSILSTDFSEIAIINNKNRSEWVNNLIFEVLDISKPMKLDNCQFDIVYARLSLHYFPDKQREFFLK